MNTLDTKDRLGYIKLRQDYTKLIESYVAYTYSWYVRPGDIVIDAGFNYGMHLYPLARLVGPAGGVIGVEANPVLAKRVAARVDHEKLKHVTIHNKALFEADGVLEFVTFPNKLGWSHINHGSKENAAIADEEREIILIEGIRYDGLDLSGVRFLKSDLEGADFCALRGGAEMMRKYRPLVVFEMIANIHSEQYGFDYRNFEDYFKSIDYVVYDIHGTEYGLKQWNSAEEAPFAELVALPNESSLIEEWLRRTEIFWASCVSWSVIDNWQDPPLIGLNPPYLVG